MTRKSRLINPVNAIFPVFIEVNKTDINGSNDSANLKNSKAIISYINGRLKNSNKFTTSFKIRIERNQKVKFQALEALYEEFL